MRKVGFLAILLLLLAIVPVYADKGGIPHKKVLTSNPRWPPCSATSPVIAFPVFFGGQNLSASGRFGVAGCTYPFGTTAKVYFTDVFDHPIAGLPSLLSPFLLNGSLVDSHMHKSFPVVPLPSPNEVIIHADVPGASFTYIYGWFKPYCPIVCDEPSVGQRFNYVGWTPAGSPPGSFTLFENTDLPNTSLSIYFVNRQNGGSVPGLPSVSKPFRHTVGLDTSFAISFTLPDALVLDTGIYNVDATLVVDGDPTLTVWPMWFHKFIP